MGTFVSLIFSSTSWPAAMGVEEGLQAYMVLVTSSTWLWEKTEEWKHVSITYGIDESQAVRNLAVDDDYRANLQLVGSVAVDHRKGSAAIANRET